MDAIDQKLAFVLPVNDTRLQAWDITNTRLIHERSFFPYVLSDPCFGTGFLAMFFHEVENMGFFITNKEITSTGPAIRISK